MSRFSGPSCVDRMHSECVQEARDLMMSVVDTHQINGFVDFVASSGGRSWFVEVKDGALAPSARRLTEEEKKFAHEWRAPNAHIVIGCKECVRAIVIGTRCAKCGVRGPIAAIDYIRMED